MDSETDVLEARIALSVEILVNQRKYLNEGHFRNSPDWRFRCDSDVLIGPLA